MWHTHNARARARAGGGLDPLPAPYVGFSIQVCRPK